MSFLSEFWRFLRAAKLWLLPLLITTLLFGVMHVVGDGRACTIYLHILLDSHVDSRYLGFIPRIVRFFPFPRRIIAAAQETFHPKKT